MFVTTAGRTNEEMAQKALSIADELGIPFMPRRKKSVSHLQEELGSGCIVVGNETVRLFAYGEKEPFFFHPSSAMFRVKRLMEGGYDPLVEAADLKSGDSFLDCTLGLASDSIVASYAAGNSGNVMGIEGDKYLSYVVKKGLASLVTGVAPLDEAMRRIEVVNHDALPFLKSLPDNSADIIYFDPMFEESIMESEGIKALRQFALHGGIGREEFEEAYRVARKRIVLKDHFKSERFEKFGFEVTKRKTAKFHYGFISK